MLDAERSSSLMKRLVGVGCGGTLKALLSSAHRGAQEFDCLVEISDNQGHNGHGTNLKLSCKT